MGSSKKRTKQKRAYATITPKIPSNKKKKNEIIVALLKFSSTPTLLFSHIAQIIHTLCFMSYGNSYVAAIFNIFYFENVLNIFFYALSAKSTLFDRKDHCTSSAPIG